MKAIRSLCFLLCVFAVLITSLGCRQVDKKITVVVREQGSGTREAFDRAVTDGVHFLEEKDENGKTRYNTTVSAVVQTKNGTLLSTVASDVNAIGYLSVGSLNDSVRAVSIEGVLPIGESILEGSYPLQRPYVIMTGSVPVLSPRTADFLRYLKSDAAEMHAKAAGCFFLNDPIKRANLGSPPIEVGTFEPLSAFPDGGKIVIRGSTSLEKLINSAAKAYAELYGIDAATLFDIQLEGSSVGRKAVKNDTEGTVIGLSSAAVEENGIDSFNLCVDAVAVVVNQANTVVQNLTLKQLYDVFCGEIEYFSELDQGNETA